MPRQIESNGKKMLLPFAATTTAAAAAAERCGSGADSKTAAMRPCYFGICVCTEPTPKARDFNAHYLDTECVSSAPNKTV